MLVYDGVEYSSISEICRYYNISQSTVRKKLKDGVSLDNILEGCKRHTDVIYSCKGSVCVFGKEFKDLSSACKFYGISFTTVKSRIDRGIPLEEALVSKGKRKDIIVNGVSYSSLREACSVLGVSYEKIKCRVRRGKTLDEAFNIKAVNMSKKEVSLGGTNYSSLNEACREKGVSFYKIRSRLGRGWSVEEAFGIVPRCVQGVIDSRVWNSIVGESCNLVDIKGTLKGKKVYLCKEGDFIRYYTKEEMFKKWSEFKCQEG